MVWHLYLLSLEHNNYWQPGTCMDLTTAAQHPIWGKIQLTITRKEKKSDILERTTTEAGLTAESTDSATNLMNTQSQGDTIGGGSPRRRRPEAGATPPTVTPLVSAQTVQNSADRGKGAGSLVLISLLLMVILALAVRTLHDVKLYQSHFLSWNKLYNYNMYIYT